MLNVRQIEAFKAVIETGTVSRAALRLCISQPAISKLIQNLEFDTGLSLFERTPGKVSPTAEALLLFEEISRLYRGLELLETAAKDIRNVSGAALSIGVMPALSTGFIQDLILEYQKRHAPGRVVLHAQSTKKITEMLVSGALDLGISSHPVDDPEIESIGLHDIPYVCVMPPGHRLGENMEITPQDLQNERFIAFSQESDQRGEIDAIFAAAGIRRDIRTEASMAPSICAMVARGLGVSIMNPLYLGAFANLLVYRRFSPVIRAQVRLLLPSHRPLSRQVKQFIQIAKEDAAAGVAPAPVAQRLVAI